MYPYASVYYRCVEQETTRKKPNETQCINLPVEVYESLRRRAFEDNRTRSSIVADALRIYLEMEESSDETIG